jgi:hypothetical protein
MPIIVGGSAMLLAALLLGLKIPKQILQWRMKPDSEKGFQIPSFFQQPKNKIDDKS